MGDWRGATDRHWILGFSRLDIHAIDPALQWPRMGTLRDDSGRQRLVFEIEGDVRGDQTADDFFAHQCRVKPVDGMIEAVSKSAGRGTALLAKGNTWLTQYQLSAHQYATTNENALCIMPKAECALKTLCIGHSHWWLRIAECQLLIWFGKPGMLMPLQRSSS